MPKKIKPQTFNQHLGAVVNSVMTSRGISQEELADALGMSLTTVGRRIRGQNPILVSELARFAEFLAADAGVMLETAVQQYGGISKLMEEGREMSVVREDNVLTFNPREATAEELDANHETARAALPRDDEADAPE